MLHYEVYIFINAYHSKGWRQVEKTHLKIFSYIFNWNTEEKVAMRFKGQKGQDTIHDITLCKYLDPYNELPIDQIMRFLCVAHPV